VVCLQLAAEDAPFFARELQLKNQRVMPMRLKHFKISPPDTAMCGRLHGMPVSLSPSLENSWSRSRLYAGVLKTSSNIHSICMAETLKKESITMRTPLKKALARKFLIDQGRKKHRQRLQPHAQDHVLTRSTTPPRPQPPTQHPHPHQHDAQHANP